MNMDGWFGRSVRRTELFDEVGAELAGSIERFDEMITGLEFLLSNHPDYYDEVPGMGGIRVGRTHTFEDSTALRVFYRLAEEGRIVELLFVERIEVSPGS